MNFRRWTHLLLILAVLVSGLSLTTPAQAQTTDPTALVIWCPAAVTLPTPKKNGCTDAFVSLNDLWSALDAAEPAQAGTIWMGKNLINGFVNGNQTFDGAPLQLPIMANFPLKFNGGWNGLGKGTLSTTTPTTFDGTALTVQNWIGGVTLLNIRVKNPATTGCSVLAAVCVLTAGKIQLDRVQVVGSSLYGASLDNTSSVSSPSSPVTVTNSLFLDNDYRGLQIETNGAVMLKTVNASHNSDRGVYIYNAADATASPVTVINGQFFGDYGYGLLIYSNGTVTLTNMLAEGSGGVGTDVDNTYGSGNVLLKGTNTLLGNNGNGLEVNTNGSISAYQLVANDNNGYGVYLSAVKAVTISGSGMFKGNDGTGLNIYTDGPITASHLTATANRYGLSLETNAPATTQAVTLSGVKANLNAYEGIKIYASGKKVTISCGSAYYNGGTGLYVLAAALKLQGFRSYWNGTDDIIQASTVVRTACP
jgi:hypothetical protein